jgi:hypothetical protein
VIERELAGGTAGRAEVGEVAGGAVMLTERARESKSKSERETVRVREREMIDG